MREEKKTKLVAINNHNRSHARTPVVVTDPSILPSHILKQAKQLHHQHMHLLAPAVAAAMPQT